MSKPVNTVVQFCLPKDNNFSNSDEFFDSLIELSKETDSDEDKWGGFLGESYLKDALRNKIDESDYKKYEHPGEDTISTIKETVKNAGNTAQKELQNPNAPLKVFVYPWFPGEDMEVFEGTMGTTFWAGSFHLYIDLESFSQSALRETVVHEYNHAVRLNYFSPFKQTMLEAMVMEGLAEIFREEVLGGEPASWSQALTKDRAKKALRKLEDKFDVQTDDRELYQEIFFGQGDYDRWTGYSCGYHIVKSYRSNNSDISWKKLVQKEPMAILEKSGLVSEVK
jgi:uncharacterized protein YjaZ